jgi:hypothetical protein
VRAFLSDLIYPEERREEAVTATLNQYLWDLYGTDEGEYLGERGVLG